MATLQKAVEIMHAAHKDAKDKAGKPYVWHPLAVMDKMASPDERIVAALHDVVEDSAFTLHDIRNAGFSDAVVAALTLLTKTPEMDYQIYIENISKDPLATAVKLGDLSHNMDLSRISNPKPADFERQRIYQKAFAFLDAVQKSRKT